MTCSDERPGPWSTPISAGEPPPAPMGRDAPPPGPPGPTPAALLRCIAAAAPEPWFPSRYARQSGIDRDALDEPLNRLRMAGLVRVVTWVRGLGQGYALTDSGRAALGDGPQSLPAGSPHPRLPSELERQLAREPRGSFAVPVLLTVNVLWFFVGLVAVVRGGYPLGRYLSDGHPYLLHRLGAVTGSDLQAGQWWRLLTACFVHIGLLHLLVNLFALAMMGPLVELLWGRWRLLLIYLLSGLAGSCLAMANRPDALLAGASGALWGLLASLVAWLVLYRGQLEPAVAADWTRRLWVVLLLNVGVSLLPEISWEAHLGGGLAGFFAAWLLNALRPGDLRRTASVVALLLMLPLVSVGGLAAVMAWGEPWAPLRQRAAANVTRQKVEAARDVLLREVVPLLPSLAPEAVRPVELQVGLMVIRSPGRRDPGQVDEIRTRLTALKATAEKVVTLVPPEPVGQESLDRYRAKVREFAAARARQLALTLALLDSPTVPGEAEWTQWGEARRAAEALWEALGSS